jgi:hypothetical protein
LKLPRGMWGKVHRFDLSHARSELIKPLIRRWRKLARWLGWSCYFLSPRCSSSPSGFFWSVCFLCRDTNQYLPITYYWTVPLILDHSYLVGKLTSSKIADTIVTGF